MIESKAWRLRKGDEVVLNNGTTHNVLRVEGSFLFEEVRLENLTKVRSKDISEYIYK